MSATVTTAVVAEAGATHMMAAVVQARMIGEMWHGG